MTFGVGRIVACGLMMAGLGLAAARAQSEADSGARTKILALENVWNNAEKAGDVGALSLILDGTLVYVDEDGSELTKTQFLEHVKEAGPQVQALATDGISVHVYGGIALVAGTYRVSGVAKGKTYRRVGRFLDTWVLQNGTWVCVAAQATPLTPGTGKK